MEPNTISSADFPALAAKVKSERDLSVQKHASDFAQKIRELSLTPEQTQAILNAPLYELVNMLNDGRVTSYALMLLFCQRAATIGLEYCMITEDNFAEAIELAKRADETRKMTGRKNWTPETPENADHLPPFFGIPISIKDTIQMKGFSCTIGCISRAENKVADDGAIVKMVRKAGMIPFVKSNIPQLAMTYESVNRLWGRALNPWNKERAVGGSSGGEGALIAARCSPIGIGSDIGGSIRIPAEFCGIYSLKPSTHRLSFQGHTAYCPSFDGQINIPPVMGPMGKSVEDLARFMKMATDYKYYDNEIRDMYVKMHLFDDKAYRNPPKQMRVGYFKSIDFIPATAASQRAVVQSIEALRRLGHEIVEIQLPDAKDMIGLFFEMVTAQGGLKGYKQLLKGQAFIDEYTLLYRIVNYVPGFLHGLLSGVAGKVKPRLGFLLSRCREKSAYEYLCWSNRQKQAKHRFIELWKSQKLDIIICPGFGSQAQKHGFSNDANLAAAYTFIWNVLEMTAGSMPITVVRHDEENYTSEFNDPINQKLADSAQGSAGLPVGIQVVGMPFEEQKVLGAMRLIQKEIPFYQTRSYPL